MKNILVQSCRKNYVKLGNLQPALSFFQRVWSQEIHKHFYTWHYLHNINKSEYSLMFSIPQRFSAINGLEREENYEI